MLMEMPQAVPTARTKVPKRSAGVDQPVVVQLLLRANGAPVGLRKRPAQSALFGKGTRRPRLWALFHSGGFDLRAAPPGALPAITKVSPPSSWPSTLSGFLV